MKRVISLLYDIEEKASQIVVRAKEEKVSLNETFEKDLAMLDKTVEEEYASKLDTIKKQIDIELVKEEQALIDDCNKQIAAMELNYNGNHAAIADRILQNIIKL